MIPAFKMSISLLQPGYSGQENQSESFKKDHSATYPGSFGRLRIHPSLHFKPLSSLVYNRRKEKAMGRSYNLQETDRQHVTNRQKKDDDPGLHSYSRA
jgi:hypothetical protein